MIWAILICFFLLPCGCYSQPLPSVQQITLNGTDYQLTALVESWEQPIKGKKLKTTLKEKLKFWHRASETYRRYALLEPEGQSIILGPRRYKEFKKILKELPDKRPYKQRHPYRHAHQQFTTRWKPVSAFWFEIILSGTQITRLFY